MEITLKSKAYQRESLSYVAKWVCQSFLLNCPIWAPGRVGRPEASQLGQDMYLVAEKMHVS